MKRYGTISYLNNDKTYGPALPLQEESPQDPSMASFARYLAQKMQEMVKEEEMTCQEDVG